MIAASKREVQGDNLLGGGGIAERHPVGDWRSGFPQMYYADSTGYDVIVDGGTSLATPVMAGIA